MNPFYALIVFLYCLSSTELCFATDRITATQFLQGSQALISKNGTFKLGFFSPPNSDNRYLGIWFNKVSVMTVVWVANRDKPMTHSSGVLRISEDGNLELLSGQNQSIWSSQVVVNGTTTNTTSAQLLDSGNFVLLQQNNNSEVIWQSFEHPTNMFLPGMKPTVADTPNKENDIFRSWKSPSDPSEGNITIGIGTTGLPQVFTWNNGVPYWRSGPWDGNNFIGIGDVDQTLSDGFVLENNPESGTLDMSFSPQDQSISLHYVVESQGAIEERFWDDANQNWTVGWRAPTTECDVYGTCGPFGSCNHLNSPICNCLPGFEPKNKEQWRNQNWSGGCVRRTPLQCGKKQHQQQQQQQDEDGFMRLQTMKVPDHMEQSSAVSPDSCKSQCLKNCSCLAYVYHLNIGCMTWSKDMIDVQEFSAGGVDLFLRLASSELREGRSHIKTAVITSVVVIGATLAALSICFLWRRRIAKQGKRKERLNKNKFGDNLGQSEVQDSLLYTFDVLRDATNNFHETNKLGEGGFGPVYKGVLRDGQEIAVKRLSRASGQGMEEFMNEVLVISKLQHRNLVRLLGCCIEGDEKILIYEYMPNRSLDAFLFDNTKRELLPWERRLSIIEGICRGLLYLHRDSRLRIIHRDMKVSNILLDEELNPKISDFGMARIFGGNQYEANTRRVVGTYGYMSPEYSMGQFSEKSDVYSFGVILLEIVSGKRNATFHRSHQQSLTLLGYAWKLWNEENLVSFIDPILSDSHYQADIIKCIQVGLLCVQELAKDRPTISAVISMFDSDGENLPDPKKPPFTDWDTTSSDDQQSKSTSSMNSYSISIIQGR